MSFETKMKVSGIFAIIWIFTLIVLLGSPALAEDEISNSFKNNFNLKNLQEAKILANIATELLAKVKQAEADLIHARSEAEQFGPTFAKITKLAQRDPTNTDKAEKAKEATRKYEILIDEKKKKYEIVTKLKSDWENARKDAKIAANRMISEEEIIRTEKEIQRLIDAKDTARDAWFETRDALIQAAKDSRAEYKRIFDSVKNTEYELRDGQDRSYDEIRLSKDAIERQSADNIARNAESVVAARNEVIREAGIAQEEAEIAIRLAAESLWEKMKIYDSTTEYGREIQKGQIDSIAGGGTAKDAYELAEYGKTLVKSGSYDEQSYRKAREKALFAESKIDRNERLLLEVENPIQKELSGIIKENLDSDHIYMPPKKQVKLGLDKNYVACSDDLVLMEKSSGLSVACIKRTTVEHLEFRGWKIISQ